jgi:hypothetical protein
MAEVIVVRLEDEKLARRLVSEPAATSDAHGHLMLCVQDGEGGAVDESKLIWPIFKDAWRRIR